jgi:hypothetical protein
MKFVKYLIVLLSILMVCGCADSYSVLMSLRDAYPDGEFCKVYTEKRKYIWIVKQSNEVYYTLYNGCSGVFESNTLVKLKIDFENL